MASDRIAAEPRRITLVADELRGIGGGGIGTATSFLAVALGRSGHDVEVLYVGAGDTESLPPDWARVYEGAGVRVRRLPPTRRATEPPYFARMRGVDEALRADPPEVVITQDLAAPAYTALRLRQAGLAFENTLFVVYCHGTRQWITDMARKVRVLPGAMGIGVLEQASIELADVAVSPSAYMLDWMRRQGWRLPATALVIPLLTRSAATGSPPPRPANDTGPGRVDRLVFFGRLEERKGIRPFAAGLNALEPELLAGVELEFFGTATEPWPPSRVEALLAERTKVALGRLAFETGLDQQQALARLSRPGTLAVMPSLEDNSPATVYECLERGIPFLASTAGGTSELVAEADRRRVLFEPTAVGVEDALRRALQGAQGLRPAQPAFSGDAALAEWLDVVAMTPPGTTADAAVHDASEWVLLLDADDVADERLKELLLRAQQASGADVVTCGLNLETEEGTFEQYFPGDPGALGLLQNGYGGAALVRRSLLPDASTDRASTADANWPLLARLALQGATIVAVPLPLVRRRGRPGDLSRDPSDALVVAQELERHLPGQLRLLPRLAGALAAAATVPTQPRPGVTQRLRNRLAGLVAR